MNYNIHLQVSSGDFNLFDISKDQLNVVVKAYLNGDSKFTISGETCDFGSCVHVFRVFENSSGMSRGHLESLEDNEGWTESFNGDGIFEANQLKEFGKEVTDQIVGDRSFGSEKEKLVQDNENFISQVRIQSLEEINGNCLYDLSKLISLCKEINDNFVRGNYYSVALLLRTILNHVPPAFNGKESFDQVLAELNGPKHKTKKEILSRLHELQRKFADLLTHERLRDFEPVMTLQQVSFIPEVDYLLQEVLTELKKK